MNEHVSLLCKKASRKLNALSWIAPCMTFDQRRLILNSFITSHFSYCPVVWMFYSRKLNERINHIHERAPRIVYKDCNSSFQEFLIEDKSLNINPLITEMYKNLWLKSSKLKMPYHLSSWMMFFSLSKNHTPYEQLRSRKIRTTKYGIETSSYLGPKLWNLVPNEYKTIESLEDLKAKIKTWAPENCPCRLRKTYLHQVSFI